MKTLCHHLIIITSFAAMWLGGATAATAQTPRDDYEAFRRQARSSYEDFRRQANSRYADYMRLAWQQYHGETPQPAPVGPPPVPPRPYEGDSIPTPSPPEPVVEIEPVAPAPQPQPVAPVKDTPVATDRHITIPFHGLDPKVRVPGRVDLTLHSTSPDHMAAAWTRLSDGAFDNTLRDCLEIRTRHNLCDWAYLSMLSALGRELCSSPDAATMLTAWLYCQSGYQMRLATSADSGLHMLFGSRHIIYDLPYFTVGGSTFYPLGDTPRQLNICAAEFDGEKPLSLHISTEQLLGSTLSPQRTITSRRYGPVTAHSSVPVGLIDFYSTYPTSAIGGNPLTRWAMYAEVPLAETTRSTLYPDLRGAIAGKPARDAANALLNWVQTGFVYEYDEKVWGTDRAFFAEETLFYPYCDCEDRSILFARLVRDLLGLDVALVHYPGHLATAVCFADGSDNGSAILLDGRRFVICDPTYIGAPVGAQMPGLDTSQTRAIVLGK